MLKLWKNPMLPIEERLAVADGEIERLRSLLNNAETLYEQRDAENERLRERLRATLEIALEIQDNLAGSQFDIGYIVDQCAVALNPDSITVPNA